MNIVVVRGIMHIKKALLQYKPILTVKTCASKHLSYLKISNAMEM